MSNHIVILKKSSSRVSALESIRDKNVRVIIALNGSYYFDQCVETMMVDDYAITGAAAVVVYKETKEHVFSMSLMTWDELEDLNTI